MKKILIVDDSRVVRKFVSAILEDNNFIYFEAEDGIEALEVLVLNDIDLIITDLNMPRMSGLELVRSIRDNNIYNSIPILMLTTETSEDNKRKCLQAGVNIYLAKPLPPTNLMCEINRLLG